jgi:hypothetical protein
MGDHGEKVDIWSVRSCPVVQKVIQIGAWEYSNEQDIAHMKFLHKKCQDVHGVLIISIG